MDNNLSFSWGLKGTLEQQIKDAQKNTERLVELIKELNVDLEKVTAESLNKNIKHNVNEAEKALYKLLDAKENLDKAMSRNSEMRSKDFLGIDDSKLQASAARIDDVINKIMGIGYEAALSKNAVKDLLATMSADLTLKDAKNSTKTADKELDKQIKERERSIKEGMRMMAAAEKEEENAAATNLRNQERIKDSLAKIATARANLSAASEKGSQQEAAHAQLLMALLDRLSSKLNTLRGEFLGEKGALDGVLGSGYNGLMRNVNTAIRNMSNRGMSDSEWETNKALAAQEERRREIKNAIDEQAAAQERAAAKEAADVARVNEILDMRRHRMEMEQKKNEEILAQNERRLAIEGDSAAWHNRNKEMADAAAREKELLKLKEAIIKRYEQESAAQERATVRQNEQYQARQKNTQATRQQAEELVRLRMELLRTQAAELQNLMKNGKGVFSPQQYQEVQDALRKVRQELLMLEQVSQRMSSYSTRDLFGFGRGSQNWSPLISNGNQILGTLSSMTNEERAFVDSIKKANDAMGTQSRLLDDLKTMAQGYFSIMGAKSFIDKIIETGGQLENQRRSIAAILGEAAYANDLFEKIQTLALKSPFGVVDLDQYTKQLSAYGFEYNELFEWTKRLADISAGTGTDFSRLTLALGHVRSEMALTGYTLRQFAMGNIPMLQKLSENLGVTTQEIRKMVREKKISYEDVAQVLKDLTDEGGMFYNMQEVISESVKSRFKNLRDAMDIMYGQIAEGTVGDALKEVAKILTELTKRWQTLMPVILTAIAGMTSLHLKTLIYNSSLKQNVFSLLQQANSYKNLSAQQVRQMYLNKELTQEEILMGVATRKLTADQAALAAEMFNVNRAQLQQVASMKSGMIGMASKFLTPANLGIAAGFIGVEAVVATYSAYNSWIEGIENRVNMMVENSKAGLDELSKYENELNQKPTDEREMKSQSDEMMTVLKNAGLWTNELEKQVGLTESLSSQYDVLASKIKEGRTELEGASQDASVLTGIIEASSVDSSAFYGDPFAFFKGVYDYVLNDDIGKNAEDLEKSLGKFKFFFESISEYQKDFENTIKNLQNMEDGGDKFKKLLGGLSLEDQLRVLKESRDNWDIFKSILHEVNPETDKVLDALEERLDEVIDDNNKILNDDVPKMRDKVMKILKMEKDDFDEWAKHHPEQLKSVIDGLEKYLSEKAPIVSGLMRQMFLLPESPYPLIGEPVKSDAELKREEEERKRIATNNANKKIGDIAQRQIPQLQKLDSSIDAIWLSNYFDVNKSSSDIAKAVISAKDKIKKEVEDGKRLERDTTELESELNRLLAVQRFYHFPDKNKGSKSSTDQELKTWREELKEIENFYKIYERNLKYMSKDDAIQNALDSGVFLNKDKMPKNIDDYLSVLEEFRGKIEKALKKKSTPERKSFLTDLLAKIDETTLEVKVKKPAEAIVKQFDKELKEQSKKWDIYKRILDASGNSEYAKEVAFGVNAIVTAKNEADELKSKIESLIAGTKADGKTVEELLGLDDEGLKNLDIFEKNTNGIYQLLNRFREASDELRKENSKYLEDALKDSKDLDTTLSSITRNYDKLREAVEATRNANNGAIVDRTITGLNRKEREERSKEIWKDFMKSSDYEAIFSDLGGIDFESLKRMLKSMERVANGGELTVKEMKEWREAMDKIINEIININPIKGMTEAYKEYKNATDDLNALKKTIKDSGVSIDKQPKAVREEYYRLLQKQTKAMNLLTKSISALASQIQQFGSSIQSLGNSIGGNTGQTISAIGGMFSDIGNSIASLKNLDTRMTGLSGVMNKVSVFTAVLSSIIDANMKLDSILPDQEKLYNHYADKQRKINEAREAIEDYTVAVAKAQEAERNWLAGNAISELKGLKDRRIELDNSYIQTATAAQVEYKNAGSGLSKWWPAIAGAVVGAIGAVVIPGIGAGIGNLVAAGISAALVGSGVAAAAGAAIFSGVTAAAGTGIRSAIDSITYDPGYKKAIDNMRVQTRHKTFFRSEKTQDLQSWVRENYGAKLFEEDGLVNKEIAESVLESATLVGETRETLERLLELRKQIDEVREQIRDYVDKAFSPLADNLIDAMWDFGREGRDILDGFKEYASDTFAQIAKDAVKSLVKVKIFDKYKEDLFNLFDAFSKGTLTEEGLMLGLSGFAKALTGDVEKAVPFLEAVTKMLDEAFSAYGIDLFGKNSGSSSASSSIRGITEETADLIASYLNAIRADVSVNRETLKRILDTIVSAGVPNGSPTTYRTPATPTVSDAQQYLSSTGQFSEMPAIAQAQLNQLRLITDNTSRNAESAEAIYNILKQNTLEGNQFHIA